MSCPRQRSKWRMLTSCRKERETRLYAEKYMIIMLSFSSHCLTEADCAPRHSESQPVKLGSLPLPPSSIGPITILDLILPPSTIEDSSVFKTMKPKHPARPPPPLRKKSYLSANKRSEVSIPLQT